MTKCGICDYKIEGDVYLVKIITEYHKHTTRCHDCGRIHNTNKNGKTIRICGICHYDYEQKADHLGYVENEFVDKIMNLPHFSIIENDLGLSTIHDDAAKIKEKPYTIRILGKETRKRFK